MSYDKLIEQLASYVVADHTFSELAYQTAIDCLFDTMGCGILALSHPECQAVLGPIVPGTQVPNGVPIPGTTYQLDPIKAAFDIGAMNRWLDFNDTWLAKEWGHPSDNFAAILSMGCMTDGVTMHDVLNAAIKAYEIQGVLALNHAFNARGLDHVILVKLASTAAIAGMMKLPLEQVKAAISQCFVDGQSLRTYRHAPNTGPRKSWAAGDASARAVQLTWLTQHGQSGYKKALSTKRWGFESCYWDDKPLTLSRPLASYCMEHILFKILYPAEFHAQTAVEAALKLHAEVKDRFSEINRIELETQEAGFTIIHKTGPLVNAADRDHCLEYMVAVALMDGQLTHESYSDKFAHDPLIDKLRDKMTVVENKQFTTDYFDQNLRAIPNSVQVFYKGGEKSERVQIDFPIGHPNRRAEGASHLHQKFCDNILTQFDGARLDELCAYWKDTAALLKLTPRAFLMKFSA